MAPAGVVHRPGPLKQSNKAHKGGRRGKRQDNGKIGPKVSTKRKNVLLSRIERKNQLNQLRKAKREEILKQKGRLGGMIKPPPVLAMILAVDDAVSSSHLLEKIKSSHDELEVTESEADGGFHHCHIRCPRFKQRYTFVTPDKSDLHAVMDALKVCECLILLHSNNPIDEYTDMLLSVIMAYALPTTIHVIQDLNNMNPKKKSDYRKAVTKALESRFPDVKLQQADSNEDLKILLRQIGDQKKRPVSFRDNRPHLLVENAQYETSDSSNPGCGTLKVTGYVRGQPLNVNELVHIPGWGNFQLSALHHVKDPHSLTGGDIGLEMSDVPDPKEQESLQSEVVPDPMDAEQTWPTEEELAAVTTEPRKTKRRVIEGTSEYQSAWIVDSDEDEDDSDEDDAMSDDGSEEKESIMDETESVVNIDEDNYDKNIDMDEENKTLVRFKEERMNQMFPDEEDTPVDVSARVRYQKYRGLKDFKNSPWDPMENLPLDYARIYRFENFKQTKRKVLTAEREGAEPGEYVTLHVSNVPQSLYDNMTADRSVVVLYGVLKHEQKMSVVNTVIRKHPSCKAPIKSKDTLIFHMGYSRFTCKPIFSEHKTGNKFKIERFLPSDSVVVASFFAPVMFAPGSVVVFRQTQNGSHQLVATGSILDVNPNRVIVKRVVLSGHPFKILKRMAVIRFMFFNREDINWFKCVELQTKCGRRGHIREAIGSHGHMKCIFDKQLQSQDVALMCLYKRVFPKWTYDPYVPTPVRSSKSIDLKDCNMES